MEAAVAVTAKLSLEEKLDKFLERDYKFRSSIESDFTDLRFTKFGLFLFKANLWFSGTPLIRIEKDKVHEHFRKQNRAPRQSLQNYLGDSLVAYTYFVRDLQVLIIGAWEDGVFQGVETCIAWA